MLTPAKVLMAMIAVVMTFFIVCAVLGAFKG